VAVAAAFETVGTSEKAITQSMIAIITFLKVIS
jgi:hypothetical protein